MASSTSRARGDIVLLLLYVPGATGQLNECIRGRTRLVKMLFIFGQELWKSFRFDQVIPETALPDFYAWRFGPFSKDVFDDVEFFRRIGFIEVRQEDGAEATLEEADEYMWWQHTGSLEDDISSGEYTQEVYALTQRAMEFVEAEGIYSGLSDSQRQALVEFKRRFNDAPLHAILRYVYSKYPEMTEKSEIRDQF